MGGRKTIPGTLTKAYTKELLLSAAVSRKKYHMYLDEQRRLKQDVLRAQKRKGLMEEIT